MNEQAFVYLLPQLSQTSGAGALQLSWPAGRAPFGASVAIEENEAANAIHLRRGVLSREECERVIALGEALPATRGGVESGDSLYRVSNIVWLEPSPETHWLFHKLGAAFLEANRAYRFELVGLLDALQYTVYGSGQYFDWHIDLGPGRTSTRKLSMTIQLSPAGEYDGGALEFINAPAREEAREQGAATVFPSYLAHRVSPVTRGVRRSLVAWASGSTFR
jgi:predicted 2-oxoglutarate/Fe(II)-dependent dioxygenase YbiX